MKQIRLLSMKLTNFKGIRSKEVDFDAKTTIIKGANGTGKTTLFDAFCWTLFGKDSQDRKTFEIKTLDKNGKAIERIPHEVECVLDVDGQRIVLARRYEEKWIKRRGEAEEQMTGHEETRLYNNVPLSTKEWAAKIDAICTEEMFRYITNPLYFTSQKADKQRELLLRMAGTVTDAELAEGNEDFADLLKELSGKTAEEYRKELAADKRRLKAERDGIPQRIDELERMVAVYGEIDTAKAQSDLAEAERQISLLTDRMQAIAAQSDENIEQRKASARRIDDLMHVRYQRTTEIRTRAMDEYQRAKDVADEQQRRVEALEREAKAMQAEAERADQEAVRIANALVVLRQDYRNISASQLTFDADAFVCPTCHRPLEMDDVEAKRAEMLKNFNADKAARLMDNNDKGKALKADKEAAEQRADVYRQRALEAHDKADAIKAAIHTPDRPNYDAIIVADSQIQEFDRTLEAERVAFAATEPTKNEEETLINAQLSPLMAKADEAKGLLRKADEQRTIIERIETLEKSARKLSQQIANIECTEFTMAEMSKARMTATEDKINGLFENVKFRMYREQLNGGEMETCEATVDGVPFASLNHARQITTGVEIINAISRYMQTEAPIFIDNAEALNEAPTTDAQSVLLYVSDCKTLIVMEA